MGPSDWAGFDWNRLAEVKVNSSPESDAIQLLPEIPEPVVARVMCKKCGEGEPMRNAKICGECYAGWRR